MYKINGYMLFKHKAATEACMTTRGVLTQFALTKSMPGTCTYNPDIVVCIGAGYIAKQGVNSSGLTGRRAAGRTICIVELHYVNLELRTNTCKCIRICIGKESRGEWER